MTFKSIMTHRLIKFLSVLFFCTPALLQAQDSRPVVAIIIDDLGDNLDRGISTVTIPGKVTVSILPHKKYSYDLAELAHHENKEVMLHLPMQPISTDKDMGPGGLRLGMSPTEIKTQFRNSYASIPHVAGVNNHMGSLLTANANAMNWLMQEIQDTGQLYFVDSRTHHQSVANFMASENNLSHASRDIFLDHEIDLEKIEYYFAKMISQAKRTGFALAIGHPHKETLSVLSEWVPKLESFGVRLVPVSEYIALKLQRERLWHASLSSSRKAAKN